MTDILNAAQVSSWTQWGSCSKSCGFGKSQRARTVTRNAKHSGNACPVLQETKTCNRFQCPVNCEVGTLELHKGMMIYKWIFRWVPGVHGALARSLAALGKSSERELSQEAEVLEEVLVLFSIKGNLAMSSTAKWWSTSSLGMPSATESWKVSKSTWG